MFASKTEIAITVDGDTASAPAVIDGEQIDLDALEQDFMASGAGVPFRLRRPRSNRPRPRCADCFTECRNVKFHGSLAKPKAARDLLVGPALRKQVEDVSLTAAQHC